jgi:hypothetical protein
MTTYTANVIADPDNPDELLLDLGLDLCEKMGWRPGELINWTDNKDGTWTMTKSTAGV